MKAIFGLGNVGSEYEQNRHNVGFLFVDYLKRSLSLPEKYDVVKDTAMSVHDINGLRIAFCKPQLFMNRSGKCVRAVTSFYKIKAADIFVAHDDLDIQFGKFKVQLGVGPKVHNGINSIIESLGDTAFWRVRFGVESRSIENKEIGKSFVLKDFNKEDLKILNEAVFPAAKEELFKILFTK